MRFGERVIKAAVGLVVLFVLLVMVTNWITDYRSVGEATTESVSGDSTQSVVPTASAEPESEGEGAAAEKPASPTTGKTVIVLVDGLNFRSAATRDAELIRGLDANERLELLGEQDGWLQVRDSNGKIGYVSASGSYTRVE